MKMVTELEAGNKARESKEGIFFGVGNAQRWGRNQCRLQTKWSSCVWWPVVLKCNR